jgi:hypothetical protein
MPADRVSYDLRAPGQRYDQLIEEVTTGPTRSWDKPLEWCFLLLTNESAEQLYARLKAKLDANDFILVMPVCRPHQGWLVKTSHDWIITNLPYGG